jgi:thiol-disulfide isomerase/thioredoxin
MIEASCQSVEPYHLERDEEKNPILTQEIATDIVESYVFEEVMTGANFTIKDLQGKLVVVDFWQTWCAPCIKNFKKLQVLKNKWPNKLEIVAASPDWADKPRQIKKFITRNKFDFRFVYAGDLERKLKLGSIPYKFIIDEKGKLVQLDPEKEEKVLQGLLSNQKEGISSN